MLVVVTEDKLGLGDPGEVVHAERGVGHPVPKSTEINRSNIHRHVKDIELEVQWKTEHLSSVGWIAIKCWIFY